MVPAHVPAGPGRRRVVRLSGQGGTIAGSAPSTVRTSTRCQPPVSVAYSSASRRSTVRSLPGSSVPRTEVEISSVPAGA